MINMAKKNWNDDEVDKLKEVKISHCEGKTKL